MPDNNRKKNKSKFDLTIDSPLVACYIYLVMFGHEGSSGTDKESKLAKYDKQFKEVVAWAKRYKVNVVLESGAEDCYSPTDKKIVINSRLRPEARYYTLLHECGHLLIDKRWRSFERDNPMFAVSSDLRVAKSKAYRVSIVAEEIEAWKCGRRLSKRLGHTIDEKKYDKMISENVMSYIEWAAVGGGEI